MRCQVVVFYLSLCAGIGVPAFAQDGTVERSGLFDQKHGEIVEDSGVLTVLGGRFARREAFEVVRTEDGGRSLTSVITGVSQPYRVEGRWTFDANERALTATGKASYNGVPADVEIVAHSPGATITVTTGDTSRTLEAPCDPTCLIDMAPSALAMFTMTRLVSAGGGESGRYNWIGQGLTFDQALLEGHADIRRVKTQQYGKTEVIQYYFVEILTNAETGAINRLAFNLYVDSQNRPLAFATQCGTVGTRSGFETLTGEMPPVFEEE